MIEKLLVEANNVKVIKNDLSILNDVNFLLGENETCYLIGTSGSGKSTFLKLLYAADKVTDGSLEVMGYDLTNITRKRIPDLRRKLGMVFQDFNLFKQWTVASNLSFVMVATDWRDKEKIRARVEEVLEQVGLLSNFNTKVHKLSGGEQQRLAIARAIINRPELILADEPTGNLDPDTSDEILYLLNKISNESKTSILLATHDYRIIDKFPARVVRCQNGNLIEGTY